MEPGPRATLFGSALTQSSRLSLPAAQDRNPQPVVVGGGVSRGWRSRAVVRGRTPRRPSACGGRGRERSRARGARSIDALLPCCLAVLPSCCLAVVLSRSSGGASCLWSVRPESGVRPGDSGRGCADEALPAAAVALWCRAAVVRVVWVLWVVRWSVVLVLGLVLVLVQVPAAERRCRLGPMNRAAGRSLRWCLPVVPVGLPHRLFLRWSFCCGGSAAGSQGAGLLAVAAFGTAGVLLAVTAGGASSLRTAVATTASGAH